MHTAARATWAAFLEQALEIEQHREKNNLAIESTKSQLDTLEAEFETNLAECTVEAHEKVYTRVTIQFGDETVTTKRTHGGSVFSFNQCPCICSTAQWYTVQAQQLPAQHPPLQTF